MTKTLEMILEQERKTRHEEGDFGIKACKECIKTKQELFGQSLFQQLEEYVERANNEMLFNDAMVLACWELINEQ